jgi:hypothetical protein
MTPMEESQSLVSSGMDLAEKLLNDDREFYPFAVIARQAGSPEHVGADTGEESPQVSELLEILFGGLTAQADAGEIHAAAIFVNVLFTPPDSEEQVDAVQVAVEHREQLYFDAYFPYRFEESGVQFGEAIAYERDPCIFAPDSA